MIIMTISIIEISSKLSDLIKYKKLNNSINLFAKIKVKIIV